MISLREELRQKFERHPSMDFNERNDRFEDGLLEKIINLTFANLDPGCSCIWKITAVRSTLLLQKLYKIINDKTLLFSAVALIISGNPEYGPKDTAGISDSDLRLLLLSLTYAAKYYCIDSYSIRNADSDLLTRELAMDRHIPISAITCLGRFETDAPVQTWPGRRLSYSDIVKEI